MRFSHGTLVCAMLMAASAHMLAQSYAEFKVYEFDKATGTVSGTVVGQYETDSIGGAVSLFKRTGSPDQAKWDLQIEVDEAFRERSTRRLHFRHGSRVPAAPDFQDSLLVRTLYASYWEVPVESSADRAYVEDIPSNRTAHFVIDSLTPELDYAEAHFGLVIRTYLADSGPDWEAWWIEGTLKWDGRPSFRITTDQPNPLVVPKPQASDTTINATFTVFNDNEATADCKLWVVDPTKSGSEVFQEFPTTTDANGQVVYPIQFQADAEGKDYTFRFYAQHPNGRWTDTIDLVVEYKKQLWEYQCSGNTVLTFDAGDGNSWRPVSEGSPLITATGSILVNGVIEMDGTVRVNTTPGQHKVYLDEGRVFLRTVDENGAPIQMPLDLLVDENSVFQLPDCTGLFNVGIKQGSKYLSQKLFGGIAIEVSKLEILNRGNAKGIDIEGKITLGPLARSGCNADDVEARRAITIGIALTETGFDNLRVKAENLRATDAFCLQELSASLDNFMQTATLGAKVKTSIKGVGFTGTIDTYWKSNTGQLGAEDLKLDSLLAELELDDCKPIGQTGFCFQSAKFSTSGWASQQSDGLALRLGTVINTVDTIVKKKAPFLSRLLEGTQLAQLEGTVEYTHPGILVGKLDARVIKIANPFKSKPWQVEGSLALMLDFYNRLRLTGTGNFFHLGADDYFVSGSMSQEIYWNPNFGYTGQGKITFRLPSPGPELLEMPGIGPILQFCKYSGYIPQTLGEGSVLAKLDNQTGFLLRGSIDVSQHPIDYFRGFGYMSAQVTNDATNGWDVSLYQGSLPAGSSFMKGPIVDAPQAQEADTIVVGADLTRVFVIITGKTTAPASTLTSPSGTEYTVSTPDSDVLRFETPGNEMVQWTIIDPEEGAWILRLDDPDPEDKVDVMAHRAERPFEISASQNGSAVDVQWETQGANAEAEVWVYLDENDQDYDGVFLGSTTESTGSFAFTMPTELSQCNYHVYAIRVAPGAPEAMSYADDPVATAGSSIAQPLNVDAVANDNGRTTIQWDMPDGSIVDGFHVLTLSDEGVEELVGSVFGDERMAEVDIDEHFLKRVFVRAYDAEGNRSCPTEAVSILTSVDEELPVFAGHQGTIKLIPNPARDVVAIEFETGGAVVRSVTIHDVTGRTLVRVPVDAAAATGRLSVDCHELTSGAYVVRLTTDHGEISGMLAITR